MAAALPGCLLPLLERWLQSSAGAQCCDKDGFVLLTKVLEVCQSLRSLTGGSVGMLAAVVANSPANGAVELHPGREAVRFRSLLERVRNPAEQHVVAEGGIVSVHALVQADAVAAALGGLPEASERLEVLRHALRTSAAVVVRGRWAMPLCEGGPAALPTSALSADAPVFQPSWQQAAAAAEAAADAERRGAGEARARRPAGDEILNVGAKTCADEFHAKMEAANSSITGIDKPSALDRCTTCGTVARSEPDSEPDAEASPKEDGAAESLPPQASPKRLSRGTCEEAVQQNDAPVSLERREEAAPRIAQASPTSWAAQQRLRRTAAAQAGDQEVARAVKSILNKLTIEKFAQLSQKLLDIEFRTREHLELLIQEVFEKATMQHHFLEMYADLCIILHEFFSEHPVGEDPKFTFKRALLNQCQASFERNLVPPDGLADLEFEERIIEETKYKTRMVGNIRLVGHLLTRKLIPTKVMLAILDELLSEPTPESLEAAASLLTVVGPAFDLPDSGLRPVLTGIFARIKSIVGQACEGRARCLLRDVLELRAGGWRSNRPTRQELPTTLRAVADRAAAEGVPAAAPRVRA